MAGFQRSLRSNRRRLIFSNWNKQLVLGFIFFAYIYYTAQGPPDDLFAPLNRPLVHQSQANEINYVGKTKIVAFCNYNYRSVALTWYQRMTRLGYTSHVIVATDEPMVEFLQQQSSSISMRYEVALRLELPPQRANLKKTKRDTAVLQLLMAVRWRYLVSQLEQGIHILLTDVDNIFSRYIDVDATFLEPVNDKHRVDVWHAYATKFPPSVFASQGFVVCSGMSWWRASPQALAFAKIIHGKCGDLCDDQRVLNQVMSNGQVLGMNWEITPEVTGSRLSNETEPVPGFVGLYQAPMFGVSNVTGHRAGIWSRDFAYRGLVNPQRCPKLNWVSMPILDNPSRSRSWLIKKNSFDDWDRNCPYRS